MDDAPALLNAGPLNISQGNVKYPEVGLGYHFFYFEGSLFDFPSAPSTQPSYTNWNISLIDLYGMEYSLDDPIESRINSFVNPLTLKREWGIEYRNSDDTSIYFMTINEYFLWRMSEINP